MTTCDTVLKSGKNIGEVCGIKAKFDGKCGRHKEGKSKAVRGKGKNNIVKKNGCWCSYLPKIDLKDMDKIHKFVTDLLLSHIEEDSVQEPDLSDTEEEEEKEKEKESDDPDLIDDDFNFDVDSDEY